VKRYVGKVNGVRCYVVNKDWRAKFKDRGRAIAEGLVFRTPEDYWDEALRERLSKRRRRKHPTAYVIETIMNVLANLTR
jgi:hypothetical protein